MPALVTVVTVTQAFCLSLQFCVDGKKIPEAIGDHPMRITYVSDKTWFPHGRLTSLTKEKSRDQVLQPFTRSVQASAANNSSPFIAEL